MKKDFFSRAGMLLFFFALAGAGLCAAQTRTDQKLTAAELVARHLDSIGSAEARARVHGMNIKGACRLQIRMGGNGQVDGRAVMSSQANLNLINMTFESADYPGDSLKFDGKKFTASQFKPGYRTSLAQFFVIHEVLFRDGLIGGTLSSSWSLADLQQKNPKLEYAGLKKIGGKQMHALKYEPRKGSDIKITLFFDPETFRHVRTEYEQTVYATDQTRISGGSGRLPATGPQRSSNAKVTAYEEFSDFKPEGQLTLPHLYKFELEIQSETRPTLVDWTFTLTDFVYNLPLDAKEFSGQEK